MSKYFVPDKYDKFQCPFDKNHNDLDAKIFVKHLLKCRKNHPHVKISNCPFNHRHIIRPEEYQHHIMNCPDKVRIDQDIYKDSQPRRMRGNIPAPPVSDFKYESTENWDDDDEADAIPSLIAMQYAQRNAHSVMNQFPQMSGLAATELHKPQPRETRMPRQMPQIMQMNGLADPKQAMALAGIGRGMPTSSNVSLVNGSAGPVGRGSASINGGGASINGGGDSINSRDVHVMNFGRGSWNAASFASSNQVLAAPGGLANRPQMGGVSINASQQLSALPGVARGRGRGRGRTSSPLVGGGSIGTPSPPSSEASGDLSSTKSAAYNVIFDPDVKISFVMPNSNKQPSSGVNGGEDKREESPSDAKYIRKLHKKLRAIERLEDKENEGNPLTEEEKTKVAMKKEVIEQLNMLTMDESEDEDSE